jgi:hypothetical protein
MNDVVRLDNRKPDSSYEWRQDEYVKSWLAPEVVQDCIARFHA